MPGLRPKKSNQREQRPVMTVEFKSSVEEFSDAEEESSIAPAAGRDSDDSSHCFQDLVQAASPIPDTHQSPPCKDSRTKKKAKQHSKRRKLLSFFHKSKESKQTLQLHDGSTVLSSTGQASSIVLADSSLRSSLSTTTAQHHQQGSTGCLVHRTQAQSLLFHYGKQSSKPADAQVQWGDVTVSSHAYTLGDNPSCPGPAIASDYKAFEHITVPLNDYEDTRPEHRRKEQLVIPPSLREDLLRDAGYARSHLKEASKQGEAIRKSRELNARKSVLERLSQFLTSRQDLKQQRAQLSDSIGWAHTHLEQYNSSRHSAISV